MLVAYFSPLAPTLMLLLSAFILPLLIKNVAHPLSQRFSGLTFLALVGLILLTTRLNAPPQIISRWFFATSREISWLHSGTFAIRPQRPPPPPSPPANPPQLRLFRTNLVAAPHCPLNDLTR